jgi:hypothetical protein
MVATPIIALEEAGPIFSLYSGLNGAPERLCDLLKVTQEMSRAEGEVFTCVSDDRELCVPWKRVWLLPECESGKEVVSSGKDGFARTGQC